MGPQIFAALQDRLPGSRASFWSFIVAGGFILVGLALAFALSSAPAAGSARRLRRAAAGQ